MTPRFFLRFTLSLATFFTLFQGYCQAPLPGCSTPYYKGNYGPPLDGLVYLLSTAVGSDASVYLGCVDYPWFSIMKLDSFGNMIRSQSYAPAGAVQSDGPGKTIVDYDGNLFSCFSNNYILRTDTAGNVLSGRELSASPDFPFSLESLEMLANGDKVFLFSGTAGGYQSIFLLVTSPDGSVIRWTKYFWSYNSIQARILAAGNKIVIGIAFSQINFAPDGSGLIQFDAGTGAILQERWFSQLLDFNQISRYNNGYIFGGNMTQPSVAPFYIRTDTALNLIAANSFPAYANASVDYPLLFQAQADGSVFGFYSSTSAMTLFLISPGDVIQWASGLFGFYQIPVSMTLAPSGIFIGTDYSATDVITGGALSGMQLYKSSYSGYFPPCTNPTPATMSMVPFNPRPVSPFGQHRDTSVFTSSSVTIQPSAGPTLVGSTCTGTPTCTSLQVTGNAAICGGSGTFSATTNGGCSLPITWSVTGGNTIITPSGNNAVSITFPQAGTYLVKALVKNNCIDIGDSLRVTVSFGAASFLGNDTTLCPGNTILLHAGTAFQSYAWQNGSTDSVLLVTGSGRYTVNVVDNCGNPFSSSITVYIEQPLANPFPAVVTKCPHDTLSLGVPAGLDSVYFLSAADGARVWNDSVQLFGAGPANYSLQEKDGYGCTVNSAIAVQVYPVPGLRIGDDTSVCPGDSVLLDAGAEFNSYVWNTGSQDQAIWAVTKGTYWVRAVTANGCVVRDSMVLTGGSCLIGFYAPNAFTPNGDGKNDVFRPLVYGSVVRYKLAVFNRWGQKVFEAAEPMKGWDGRVAGILQPGGAYVWSCTYQLQGGEMQTQRGTVLLIR